MFKRFRKPKPPTTSDRKILKMVNLPCGCQDIYYADGEVDREHDWIECDGSPMVMEPPTRPFRFVLPDDEPRKPSIEPDGISRDQEYDGDYPHGMSYGGAG